MKRESLSILPFFKGKRILITGGAGYLATRLTSFLKDIDCHIIRLDCREANFIPVTNCKAKIEDREGDVRKKITWENNLERIEVVFHFAAQTSAYVANEDPQADWKNNVMPMINLIETVRKNDLKPTVIFSSTVTVTGLPGQLPVDESCPANPVTYYDLHKLMCENYLRCFVKLGFLKGAILRFVNIYGPGPRASNVHRGILNSMVKKAIIGEPLTIYGGGGYLRDYLYIDDAITAFLTAAAKIEDVNGEYFVIGTGKAYSIFEAFNLVAERVALKTKRQRVKVEYSNAPFEQSVIELRNFCANADKFMRLTGWKPRYSFVEGIDKTIEMTL
ncbi:MAG: NAD-dependent epimerase/dehydratase family protein [Candidatus Omnitrophica bacterium]|nr:NAD-dependent epimerase/dehydratase family protein [Candidatus Omnitrophota bacterium]